MRKWIACLLGVMLAAAAFGTVLADPEKPEWEYSARDAKITKYNGPGGEVVVPAEIDGNPVIFIDGSTFPSSREDITSITFPSGIEGFYNVLNTAPSLERIVLPDTLEVIGNGALGYCPKLKEITFPASLRFINAQLLFSMDSMETVTFLGECPVISDANSVLSGLPSGAVIHVPDDQVDAYRAVLTSVSPEQIRPSGKAAEPYHSPDIDFAFDPASGTITGCSTMRGWIEVPVEIGGVPVRALGAYSFSGCTNLHAVILPDSLEEIGECAFGRLNHLTWTEIPAGVKVLGPEAFQYYKGYFLDLPDGLTEIPDRCFNASGLQSITLPPSVRSVGEQAFRGSSLREAYFPAGLESIGKEAFSGSRILEYLYFDGTSLPQIGEGAFSGTESRLADVDLNWRASKQAMLDAQAYFDSLGFSARVWRAQNPEVNYHESQLGEYHDGLFAGYSGTMTAIRPYDSYDSVETTGVADDALKGNQIVTYFAVCYNDEVTRIGKEAFADSVLEKVDLFDSVTAIVAEAFRNSRL